MIVNKIDTREERAAHIAREYEPARPLSLFTESMIALLSSPTLHTAFADLVSLMGQSFPLAAPALYVSREGGGMQAYSVLERNLGGRRDARRVLGSEQVTYVRVLVGGHPPVVAERHDRCLLNSSQVEVVLSINTGMHDEIFDEWVKLLAPAVAKMIDNEQLRDLAFRDGLTGVLNFRAFGEMLQSECERSSRYATTFALIMLDIDWFKRINDRYGHQMGDVVLKNLAGRLQQCVRKSDYVFRYGGEEFAIIMPHTDLEKAAKLAERIRLSVEKMSFFSETRITISAGVSQYEDGLSPHDLVKMADSGLYLAKQKGRNRTEVLKDAG